MTAAMFVVFAVSCGSKGQIATVDTIHTTNSATVTNVYNQSKGQWELFYKNGLQVDLKLGSLVKANQPYTVTLYENGAYKADTTVTWTQPQVNARTLETQPAYFDLTQDEWWAYPALTDLSDIFSVKKQSQTP